VAHSGTPLEHGRAALGLVASGRRPPSSRRRVARHSPWHVTRHRHRAARATFAATTSSIRPLLSRSCSVANQGPGRGTPRSRRRLDLLRQRLPLATCWWRPRGRGARAAVPARAITHSSSSPGRSRSSGRQLSPGVHVSLAVVFPGVSQGPRTAPYAMAAPSPPSPARVRAVPASSTRGP